MEDTSTSAPELPPDLRQRVASLLPPNDLALGWRLACKDAANHCSEQHQRTARVAQALPEHATTNAWCMDAAEAELRQLSFRRKLLLLSTAASSGCEANVEFAWRLLQPHVFPELLRTEHYSELLFHEQIVAVPMSLAAGIGAGVGHCRSAVFNRYKRNDVGSAAVASGLAHMLPSLEQRCPGLVDPNATMEAAARHCDLAGLQAAWDLLRARHTGSPAAHPPDEPIDELFYKLRQGRLRTVWSRVMAAAASSSTADTIAKMAWVLDKMPVSLAELDANVYGAAAASADLPRLRWLREHGFTWCTGKVLHAVVHQADLPFIQRLEQEGGYLPPPGHEAWSSSSGNSRRRRTGAVYAAASAACDAVGKLQWLAGGYGVRLAEGDAVEEAAWLGNLDAVQLLLEHCRGQGTGGEVVEALPAAMGLGGAVAVLPARALTCAVCSESVPTAAWLHQAADYPMDEVFYLVACANGDLPMVRWLLDAGCPRQRIGLGNVMHVWPSGYTAGDGERLLEAVRLLAAAGWPAVGQAGEHPLAMAARGGQPWWVLCGLRELLPVEHHEVNLEVAKEAAATGCQATLEGLVGMGVCGVGQGDLQVAWYVGAARRGDLGTLACLRRLGVPLGEGVVAAAVREGAPVPALRWLVVQGAPWSSLEVRGALKGLEERLEFNAVCSGVCRQQVMRGVKAWLESLLGGAAAT